MRTIVIVGSKPLVSRVDSLVDVCRFLVDLICEASVIRDYLIVGSIFLHNVYHVINTDTGDITMYGLVD